MKKWTVQNDNDGRHESWFVTDGNRFFETYNETDAQWLCNILNKQEKK